MSACEMKKEGPTTNSVSFPLCLRTQIEYRRYNLIKLPFLKLRNLYSASNLIGIREGLRYAGNPQVIPPVDLWHFNTGAKALHLHFLVLKMAHSVGIEPTTCN